MRHRSTFGEREGEGGRAIGYNGYDSCVETKRIPGRDHPAQSTTNSHRPVDRVEALDRAEQLQCIGTAATTGLWMKRWESVQATPREDSVGDLVSSLKVPTAFTNPA